MDKLILVIYFLACFLLIVAVLLQGGKGSAMGLFSGSGSDAVFAGASSMDFIKKFTMGLALTIAVTSVLLTFYSGRSGLSSVLDKQYQDMPLPERPASQSSKPSEEQSAVPVQQPKTQQPAQPATTK